MNNKLTVYTGNITREIEVEIRRQCIKNPKSKGYLRIFGKEEYLPSYDISELIEFINSIETEEETLIQYPETFLQDKQQALIIKLIVEKALISNITLVTHSDHIINGICVACRRYYNDTRKGLETKRGINSESVSIYYFNGELTKINLQPNGGMGGNPDGFFEQIILDTEVILGLVGVDEIEITPNAKILNAPDGFLDQSSIDRKIILGFTD